MPAGVRMETVLQTLPLCLRHTPDSYVSTALRNRRIAPQYYSHHGSPRACSFLTHPP